MSALADHRERLAERGLRRVELRARPDDARRLKAAARVLARDDAVAQALRQAIDAVVPQRSVDPFVAWALSIPPDPEFAEVMERVVADRKRHRSRKVVLRATSPTPWCCRRWSRRATRMRRRGAGGGRSGSSR